MKTCGALLVLPCCCLAETQLTGDTISDNDITHQGHYGEAETRENEGDRTETAATVCNQQTCQPDIHTLLIEMSALVAEQRVELRYTKTQMDAIEARLRASEKTVEEQREQLKQLMSDNEGRKIAFAVSLEIDTNRYTGPFNTGATLVYKHVITNLGNLYNLHTGFFTAPVKGVYDFNFYVYGDGGPISIGAQLRRNRERLVTAYTGGDDHSINASNGVSLLLEVGDVVDIYLPANQRIIDNAHHHSTFRGHLLFQV
ncbi:cerebellin-1-like [Sardina pilchardus]|uniref:cerebellin-1-like n=1 Tax=Sardina pilchardus TaxID=27697 RepID=UPI002E15FA97